MLTPVWLAVHVLGADRRKVGAVTVALLATLIFGVSLADIVYTALVLCPRSDLVNVCPLGNLAFLFTWLGSGVWGSMFVSRIVK